MEGVREEMEVVREGNGGNESGDVRKMDRRRE